MSWFRRRTGKRYNHKINFNQINAEPKTYQQEDFEPELVTEHLIKIYREEEYAEYMTSTLCIKMPVLDGTCTAVVCINLHYCRTDDEKFWCAMCYLKYRGSGIKFNDSIDCILDYAEKYDRQAEVAKVLLLNRVEV